MRIIVNNFIILIYLCLNSNFGLLYRLQITKFNNHLTSAKIMLLHWRP